MTKFKKYMHVEKFGTTEVEGIELGDCFIFPKIDGTNGSIWMGDDGLIKAGSRKRELTLDNDNAGFYKWVLEQENIKSFFKTFPNTTLYGEFLVPHTLTTYTDESWKKFYVFDVMDHDNYNSNYLPYASYKILLDLFNIEYIPPISIIRNSDYEQLTEQLKKNTYLIKDGEGFGEGIVIKNYNFVNRYGRITWAKIITNEFKAEHGKKMGGSIMKGKKMVEQDIVDKYVTQSLCDKVLAKIELDNDGFSSKNIPQLLGVVFYDLIREESWNFIKENKNPTINFRTLNRITMLKVKELLPKIF